MKLEGLKFIMENEAIVKKFKEKILSW